MTGQIWKWHVLKLVRWPDAVRLITCHTLKKCTSLPEKWQKSTYVNHCCLELISRPHPHDSVNSIVSQRHNMSKMITQSNYDSKITCQSVLQWWRNLLSLFTALSQTNHCDRLKGCLRLEHFSDLVILARNRIFYRSPNRTQYSTNTTEVLTTQIHGRIL